MNIAGICFIAFCVFCAGIVVGFGGHDEMVEWIEKNLEV